jgi:hypothetical protein
MVLLSSSLILAIIVSNISELLSKDEMRSRSP